MQSNRRIAMHEVARVRAGCGSFAPAKLGGLLVAGVLLAGCSGSPKPASLRESADRPAEPAVVAEAPADAAPDAAEPAPAEAEFGPILAESGFDTWLEALVVRDDEPGGWVTGRFDADPNRITVDTWAVSEFAVDVGRLPIDWNRLVVLRLNGVNSELRHRDQSVYIFQLDEHGQWAVE